MPQDVIVFDTENRCPRCAHPLDAVKLRQQGRGPQFGDITICVYCAAPLVFGPDLELRPADADDLMSLPPQQLAELESAMLLVASLRHRMS